MFINFIQRIYDFFWGGSSRSSQPEYQRRDVLQLSNQQLEMEIETEQSLQEALIKFKKLYKEQEEKEKNLISVRQK